MIIDPSFHCPKCKRVRIYRRLRPRGDIQSYKCKTCNHRKTFQAVERL